MKSESHHGKQFNQKMKPLLVWHYLLQNTDENHFASTEDIVAYLNEQGISAERRSIYTDINEINKLMLMIRDDCTLEEAEEALDYDEEEATIRHIHKKGYYVQRMDYSVDDIRLLAESVYAARFIDDTQMNHLIDILQTLISDYQVEEIRHDVLKVDHVRTENKDTFFYVSTINAAMSTKLEGVPHTPEKISFKYMRYSISDMNQTVARRGGEKYIVSPYKIILTDGHYYLRAFDDKNQRMQNYRIDRMKDVQRLGIKRDGKEFADVDLSDYTKGTFSMYGGKNELVSILFANSLLDTVIDHFGREKIKYHKIDDHHFTITTNVEISPQFFAWLAGMGRSAVIKQPEHVRNQYTAFLEDILKKYK